MAMSFKAGYGQQADKAQHEDDVCGILAKGITVLVRSLFGKNIRHSMIGSEENG